MPVTMATMKAINTAVTKPSSTNALAANNVAPTMKRASPDRPTSAREATAPRTAPAPCAAVRYAAPEFPSSNVSTASTTASTSIAPTTKYEVARTMTTSRDAVERASILAPCASCWSAPCAAASTSRASGGTRFRSGATRSAEPTRQPAPAAYTAPGDPTSRISPAAAGATKTPTLRIHNVTAFSATSCSAVRASPGDTTAWAECVAHDRRSAVQKGPSSGSHDEGLRAVCAEQRAACTESIGQRSPERREQRCRNEQRERDDPCGRRASLRVRVDEHRNPRSVLGQSEQPERSDITSQDAAACQCAHRRGFAGQESGPYMAPARPGLSVARRS